MVNKKTADTTAPAEEKAPRLSKLERLKRELELAKAEQQDKTIKKLNGLQASLTAARNTLTRAQERVADLERQIQEVKTELPLITDGVGEIQPEVEAEPAETTEV